MPLLLPSDLLEPEGKGACYVVHRVSPRARAGWAGWQVVGGQVEEMQQSPQQEKEAAVSHHTFQDKALEGKRARLTEGRP